MAPCLRVSRISKLKGACLWDRLTVPLAQFLLLCVGGHGCVYGVSNWIFVFKTTKSGLAKKSVSRRYDAFASKVMCSGPWTLSAGFTFLFVNQEDKQTIAAPGLWCGVPLLRELLLLSHRGLLCSGHYLCVQGHHWLVELGFNF